MTEPTPLTPRPDAEQVSRAPYTVALGSTIYQLKPLTIRASKAWKEQLRNVVGDLLDTASASADDMAEVMSQVERLLSSSDDMMLDLLANYDARIASDREQIEETATSLQAYTALMQIVRVEFPFLGSLTALRG
jgi:hypothetical protein